MNTTDKTRTGPKDLWAFWTYDLFPHMLGAKVEQGRRSIRSTTAVYVPSYNGFVEPFAVVQGMAGAQLREDIEALRAQYNQAQDDLQENFRKRFLHRLELSNVTHPNEYINYPRAEAQKLVRAKIDAERAARRKSK